MNRVEVALRVGGRRSSAWMTTECARLSERRAWCGVSRACSRYGVALVIVLAGLAGGVLQLLSPSADAEAFLQASGRLMSSDWGNTFADPFFQIGPLHLLVVSVGALAASTTGASPFFTSGAVQAALVAGLALMTARSTISSAGPDASLKRALLVGSVLLGGPLASAALHGHDEEIFVALLLVLAGSRRWRRQAAVLIGVAGCFKLWGLLGLPLLFVSVTFWDGARRSLTPILMVVLSYLPFYAAGQVGTFDYVWRVAAGAPISVVLAVGEPFDWPLRLAQGVVSVTVGLWVVRRGGTGLEALVAICCLRLLLDPNPFSYYGIALLLCVLHWVMTRTDLLPRVIALLAIPAGVVAPDLLRVVPRLYAALEALLLLLLLFLLFRSLRRRVSAETPRSSRSNLFGISDGVALKPVAAVADASGVIESQGQLKALPP